MSDKLFEELLPCPFCRGVARAGECKDTFENWIDCVQCSSCGGGFERHQLDYDAEDTLAGLVKLWNARAGGVLHVLFDGPPGPEAGRFVEVETPDGKSVNGGAWNERADGLWELRIAPGAAS